MTTRVDPLPVARSTMWLSVWEWLHGPVRAVTHERAMAADAQLADMAHRLRTLTLIDAELPPETLDRDDA